MTTLTNHHPPAAAGCGLNHPTICREESDTPHGSVAAKVAEGLVGDVQTRIVFRQATDQLADAARLLRLNDKTTALLPELTKGRALWLVAGRKAVVHHVLGWHEAHLTNTDTAMQP